MEIATSISTILLIDVDVKSFSSYIYMYQLLGLSILKTIIWGVPSLGISRYLISYIESLPTP